MIAESDLNDVRVIRPPEQGGYGLDGQWNDDFHHALHTLLTGETQGYYADFGRTSPIWPRPCARASSTTGATRAYRDRRHGNSSADRPASQFVVCAQNHDQVGNRLRGDRLIALTSFEARQARGRGRPALPLRAAPVHGRGVRRRGAVPVLRQLRRPGAGRGGAPGTPGGVRRLRLASSPPDPQDQATFLASRLDWDSVTRGAHRVMRDFYRELIALRRQIPALGTARQGNLRWASDEEDQGLWLRRWARDIRRCCACGISATGRPRCRPLPQGPRGTKRLDSAGARWHGPGATLPRTRRRQGTPVGCRH